MRRYRGTRISHIRVTCDLEPKHTRHGRCTCYACMTRGIFKQTVRGAPSEGAPRFNLYSAWRGTMEQRAAELVGGLPRTRGPQVGLWNRELITRRREHAIRHSVTHERRRARAKVLLEHAVTHRARCWLDSPRTTRPSPECFTRNTAPTARRCIARPGKRIRLTVDK